MTAANRKGRKKPPAKNPEERAADLINAAYDHAEKMFENGTASSQITTHFLELGTRKAELENLKKEYEIKLLQARTDAIKNAEKVEKIYLEALKAMSIYQGHGSDIVVSEATDEDAE